MPKRAPDLSHVDRRGRVAQVDVGNKPATRRVAEAEAFVRVSREALAALRQGTLRKGSPLEIARIAGIQAAKRTADLIPLCHSVLLSEVAIDIEVDRAGVAIRARARSFGPTGVEMEALTAVSVAALTVYDMLKAVDRTMRIEGIRLLSKSGGRSGDYRARD